MSHGESNLDFVRRAAAELALSFTDPRDHNLHAVINGLVEAIESDRQRIAALEAKASAAVKDISDSTDSSSEPLPDAASKDKVTP